MTTALAAAGGLMFVAGVDPDKPKRRPDKKAKMPSRKIQSRGLPDQRGQLWSQPEWRENDDRSK
jgi:hypothetical protein